MAAGYITPAARSIPGSGREWFPGRALPHHDGVTVGGFDGMLGSLLAPLRLPERVLKALDQVAESTRELGPIHSELTRVGKQTESLAELIPALSDLGTQLDTVREVVQALESDESHLNTAVGDLSMRVGALNDTLAPVGERLEAIEATTDRLRSEVGAIHETLRGVQEDIRRITGLRGERGVMERTRDALTGGRDRAASQPGEANSDEPAAAG